MAAFGGISGLHVTRVTRIINRFLRQRFDDKVDSLVDAADQTYKRHMEYLFMGLSPGQPLE